MLKKSKRPSGLFGFSGLLLTVLLTGSIFAEEETTPPQYPTVPAQTGEYCTVCGAPLTEKDIALIIKGRRFPLEKSMVDTFMRSREQYFSAKQMRGALFQEELNAPAGVAQSGVSLTYFLIGLYILAALIFGGLSGYTALSKGLQPIPSFFIGFFLSVLGYVYILTRSSLVAKGDIPSGLVKVPITSSPIACSQCGNTNHPAAHYCSICKIKLEPMLQSEVERT